MGLNPCPECGCTHIGDDVTYAVGWAKFCQGCGHKGPTAALRDPMDDSCRTIAEADAAAQWNQLAQAKQLQAQASDDLRFSA